MPRIVEEAVQQAIEGLQHWLILLYSCGRPSPHHQTHDHYQTIFEKFQSYLTRAILTVLPHRTPLPVTNLESRHPSSDSGLQGTDSQVQPPWRFKWGMGRFF